MRGSNPAVYYQTMSGKRLVFPNEKTFRSWYGDFGSVVRISDTDLAALPLGGNVTYRPGERLVKIATDPKVYAVAAHATLRWVQTENVAQLLYGQQWASQVDDIPDTFFINYTVGAPIAQASDFSIANEKNAAQIEQSVTTIGTLPPIPVPVANTDVTFAIATDGPKTPISPYIYGTNEMTKTANGNDRLTGISLYRFGGNRLTAYNWENNASNAGTDWGPNSSDSYLSSSNVPGAATTQWIDQAHSHNAAALITIPIVDYVAADKNGVVTEVASPASTRWAQNKATKPTALSLAPNTADHTVYEDEFVHFLEQSYANDRASGKDLFYSLDNEPGLWPGTHPLVHPAATTYAEMADRTTRFSTMIKKQAPQATVFGAVAYGYNEYVNLQNAPDAAGRDYLDFFLDNAKQAEAAAGHRVVDVLDLHWYPEAQGGGVRVATSNNVSPSQAESDARAQSPRSLWDPTYKENSWIANDVLNAPIQLIPSLKQKIAAHYPGTKLSFSEYFFGGGQHISGGIAQADVLGIFGTQQVFAATFWPMWIDATSYIYGGFDMFLNYDGAGHHVGDLSLPAATSDQTKTSIYAMADSADTKTVTLVAINKTNTPLTVAVDLNGSATFTSATAYQLTSAATTPQIAATPAIQGKRVTATLAAMSVTTMVVK